MMSLFLAVVVAQPDPEKPAIRWMPDYAAAAKQAKEQKKLLVVHFWADW